LFAAESEQAPQAESPDVEMPVASDPLESIAAAPTPRVAPTRRSHLVDVDTRLSSSHRMVARVTVLAPRVDVPYMEPESPAGRNFERTGRTAAARVVDREPVVETLPPVAPMETAAVMPPSETPPLEPTFDEPPGDAFAFFESHAADATSSVDLDEQLDESSSDANYAFDPPIETAAALPETTPLEMVPQAEDVAVTSKKQADDDLDKFLDDLGMG